MEIESSTLRLDADDLANSKLMGVELPSGSISGGLLVAGGESLVFVAFSEIDADAGDELLVPPDTRLAVTSAERAHLHEQPVTVLEVRPRETDDRGGAGGRVGP